MSATIEELKNELMELMRDTPHFREATFSAFSLEDVEQKAVSNMIEFPFAGILYDGCEPISPDVPGTARDRSNSAKLVEMQFLIVIGIQYQYAGQDDTTPQATNLLDQTRPKVMGYMGVNTRPWRFIGERPEPGASVDGVAFYSQVWRTVVPQVGSFNQQ